ncbi:hypothetical protein A9995_15305 [Erythrobacter sp. QSSC1-22B]|uniref:PilZ domain-containing protein n=1 Tax=Erythrobacter sp. QSSC1-22B TaxID=1860125 RepID=UPI0008056DC7|nr:PilZ domain-containing protein [Erythrobacter sp. QSSC1-22B]OBX17655.1 hypothetical protein A9995_15305 [Erythrobacter sp. QSSC1-22B]
MHLKAVLRAPASGDDIVSRGAAEGLQRRFAQRRSLELSAVANSPEAGETQVLVRDISPGGLLIEAEAPTLCVEDWIEVHLPNIGIAQARVVWASGRFFGCEFNASIPTSTISAALLKAKPPTSKVEQVFAGSNANHFEPKRAHLEPALNFSFAFFMAFALWALIAMAAYLLTR